MTSAALSWHAQAAQRILRAPLFQRRGRVGPWPRGLVKDDTRSSSLEAAGKMSRFVRGVTVETSCSSIEEDEFLLADAAQAAEVNTLNLLHTCGCV